MSVSSLIQSTPPFLWILQHVKGLTISGIAHRFLLQCLFYSFPIGIEIVYPLDEEPTASVSRKKGKQYLFFLIEWSLDLFMPPTMNANPFKWVLRMIKCNKEGREKEVEWRLRRGWREWKRSKYGMKEERIFNPLLRCLSFEWTWHNENLISDSRILYIMLTINKHFLFLSDQKDKWG